MNPTLFLSKYKAIIAIAIITIAIIVVIYFVGRKAGKTESVTTDIPKDINEELTQAESDKIASIASRLFDEMDGLTFVADIDLWDEYFYSSDRVFVGVYNYFNSRYGEGKTLYQWIKAEVAFNAFLFTSEFSDYRESILMRMTKLNLY